MRILVIRMSSIGDIILTTPVLKAFKEKYPKATVDFLVMEEFKEAISGVPYIDNLILFDKKKDDGIKNICKFGKKLKENCYDYVFDLHSKFRSKIIAKKIGAKTYTYKKRTWWKGIVVKLRLAKYKVDDTIVKNYFGAFKDFKLEYKGEDLTFVTSDDKKFIQYKGLPVMAVGASKKTKEWTIEGFAEVAKLIYDKRRLKSVLIGGKKEWEKCELIRKLSGNVCINLAGKLSLKESGVVLKLGKFLITNDSGPFHIARGVKTKTFVIFGATSPEMFEFCKTDILIYRGEDCSPCSLHGDEVCPKGDFKCMKSISGKDVFEKIDKLINWEE